MENLKNVAPIEDFNWDAYENGEAVSSASHEELEKVGCDVTLLAIEGADHADLRFFQREIWQEITKFFKEKL